MHAVAWLPPPYLGTQFPTILTAWVPLSVRPLLFSTPSPPLVSAPPASCPECELQEVSHPGLKQRPVRRNDGSRGSVKWAFVSFSFPIVQTSLRY